MTKSKEVTTTVTPTKILIAYHGGCIDGYTSAWVTFNALIDVDIDIEFMSMYYNDASYGELQGYVEDEKPDRVYIVDFSVPLKLLFEFRINSKDTHITILDHHKTAFELYADSDFVVKSDSTWHYRKDNVEAFLDNSKSGAGLCWDFFFSDIEVPTLVKYVQDYDLYKFEFGDNTKYINQFLKKSDQRLNVWEGLHAAMENTAKLADILEFGKELQEAHDDEVAMIASQASPAKLFGLDCMIIGCDYSYISAVGHKLCQDNDIHFAAMYVIDEVTNTVKWSLRSIGDIDVSQVAKSFPGGGGHKNAAGFEVGLLVKPFIPEPVNSDMEVSIDE